MTTDLADLMILRKKPSLTADLADLMISLKNSSFFTHAFKISVIPEALPKNHFLIDE